MTPEDWQQYRIQLRDFIQSRTSGMIFDADQEYEQRRFARSGGRAGFKLQNGLVVKEFLTIWELFDHSLEFTDCIEKLAAKSSEIRERIHYSKIVTATPTAEEISKHVFDFLKRNNQGAELSTYHFGDYPTIPLLSSNSGKFRNENVLILTDIVSTGSLIRNMTEIIQKEGGNVVSALSVVITNGDWIREQDEPERGKRIVVNQKGFRVHSLADYEVVPLGENEYDQDKLIPIDYASVLPETEGNYSEQYSPKFTPLETFEHLEQAKAIDFSFYDFDERQNTCAFILPKLLSTYREEIWQKIKDPIVSVVSRQRDASAADDSRYPEGLSSAAEQADTNVLSLVTTYKQKDILFKNFVQAQLAGEGIDVSTAITLKRSVKDIPSRNLTLGTRGREVRGKEVVLLLATLSTTQRLRNLISLLVSCQVKKITVICLLNEMGPFATSFINAIERFTKRITIDDSDTYLGEQTFTDFEFHMLYSFLDIDSDDIARMHMEVEWLFSQFEGNTKVSSFQRLGKRIKGYFLSHRFASRAYDDSNYSQLSSEYRLQRDCDPASITDHRLLPIGVRTQEGKIALITYNLALNRDFQPVIEELNRTISRKTFIHLYGLLLSDVHYLQFNKSLKKLEAQVVTRLEEVWQECFDWESQNRDTAMTEDNSYISERIGAIAYLIFGLGIFSHYNSYGKAENLSLRELLFCKKNTNEWFDSYPIFMKEYFSDERIFYFISFMMHNLIPNFSHRTSSNTLVEELNTAITEFKGEFHQRFPQTGSQELQPSIKAKGQLINNNLDTLLTEIGQHGQLEKHQTIRYLQREVLRPKEGHNPIFTTLGALIDSLDHSLEQNAGNRESFRIRAKGKTIEKIDDALTATASLSVITESVRQLFYFTSSVRDDRERYTNLPNRANSFEADVDQSINLLNDMRIRKSFSRISYNKLQKLTQRIRDDFYDDSSLRRALRGYIVCLDAHVEKTLLEANARLNREGFDNLLSPALEYIQGYRNSPDYRPLLILCEYYLLKEMLRNIFYNLRHSFPEEGTRSSLEGDSVQISFTEERFIIQPDNRNQNGIRMELFVKGNAPTEADLTRRNKTIADQLFKLQEFGGQSEISRNLESFSLSLTFVSRIEFEDFVNNDTERI